MSYCYTVDQMIRPFHLRDLPLIYRLSEQGVSLHTEYALTNHPHLLRKALISMIGVGRYPTFVWKDKAGNTVGFVQLHLEDSSHAHILHVALIDGADDKALSESMWLTLLEQLMGATGRFGVHSLVAEVNETSEALPTLRQAGFVVYTRQDVWVLTDKPSEQTHLGILSPRDPVDDWDIQLLYVNTVPRLVQLVEPTAPEDGLGLVLRDGDDLVAFVHVHEGPAGTWLRFFLHPVAESRATDLIAAALQTTNPTPEHPVYCCVRRYQSWLQNGLEKNGFTHWGSQAVMVKHMVKHMRSALPDLQTMLEANGVKGSAPAINRYGKAKSSHLLENNVAK